MPFALGAGNECDCAVCLWKEGSLISQHSSAQILKKGGKEINENLPDKVEDASFFAPSKVCSEQMTLTVAGGKLWWADEESAQLGTVTKRDGRNPLVLRNKTSGVVHMKVYDREGQKGALAHANQPSPHTHTWQKK